MTMTSAPLPGPVESLRDGAGATVLGPRNLAREAGDRDLLRPPSTDKGSLPNLRWSFADSHNRLEPGGWARETTVRELPVSTAMAGVSMRLDRGGVREMHWRKTAEWSYVLAGQARITLVDEDGRTFQADVGVGDLRYFPPGIAHSIQGTGEDGVEFLLVFDDGAFSEDSAFLLSDLFAHLPRDVLAKDFGWPEAALARIPDKELYVFQTAPPGPLEGNRIAGAGPVPHPFSHRMCLRPARLRASSATRRATWAMCRSPQNTRSRTPARRHCFVRGHGRRQRPPAMTPTPCHDGEPHMRRPALRLAALAACLAAAACATPQQRAEDRENLLSAAGFTAQPASTPARVASLRGLPPNKVVQRTRGGSVRYVYADPLVCGCLYVGDQAAYGRYRQEVFQRRLANEQEMTAQMDQMNWDDGPWGPMW